MNTFEDVIKTFQSARQNLGEILSSCEVIDSPSLDVALRHLKVANPIGKEYPFYMIIETSGSNAQHDVEKLEAFVEKMIESQVVIDGTLNTEPSRIAVSIKKILTTGK